MTIASMTGFARTEGETSGLSWVWEARSVNGRGLDVRCRLPSGLDRIDPAVRAEVTKHLKRGNVAVTLSLSRASGAPPFTVDRAVLDQVLALQTDLHGRIDRALPRLENLLLIPGVLDRGGLAETIDEKAEKVLLAGFSQALKRLIAARAEEGARLQTVLLAQIQEIDRLTAEAAGAAVLRPEAVKDRLRQQIQSLLEAVPALPEERLAQELALLAAKGDVREELDRLAAHIGQARDMLTEGGAIGRRLDFLSQEFNRESNTLCSKSQDVTLTRVGIALKSVIDQFREQIQNVE
ncbi:MAG: YicC family protein [Alphaproteobacteria bacterium]|nr:YicC family protein [Alphaproteobacteria bacterium]